MTTSTTTSPLLGRHGAVEGQGADAGVAAHYGDPVREQRLLAEGLAAVDLSHRGVVTVSGPDRLSWLHSMTTQHVLGLPARTSRESLVLSPKGHVEHALHIVDDGETTWLSVEPGTASALVSWLESMRFMLRVEVADVSDGWAVLGEPLGAESAPGEALAWVDPWPGLVGDTVAYGPVEGHPAEGRAWRELLVPREGLEAAVGDRPLAGTWAAEALRVAAWRPRLGFETDHRTIPHEVDWLRTAVHLHKGCYRGQETIARVHNLGRPPRRLVFLHLDGSGHVLPDAGSPVVFADREVGRVTTVARHHEDGPVALAVIKRSVAEDADLVVDGISAAQTVVVSG
jgi:folate-binding protein YgfZ